VDGANDVLALFRIICPIIMPGLATVGLFYCLMFWNDWWLAMLFIDDYRLHPLQMMIRSLINSMNASSYVGGDSGTGEVIPTHSVKLAVVCLTVGPIILAYPFVQRFFVKGITIGAVKG
jgi:multiple sugar transport system permease protein/putative aldouronate transport system permease protein